MPIQKLSSKPGAGVQDSAELLVWIKETLGHTVHNDSVMCYSDGSVAVDCDTDLAAAWGSYTPRTSAELPVTTYEKLIDSLSQVKNINDMKEFLQNDLIPVLLVSIAPIG